MFVSVCVCLSMCACFSVCGCVAADVCVCVCVSLFVCMWVSVCLVVCVYVCTALCAEEVGFGVHMNACPFLFEGPLFLLLFYIILTEGKEAAICCYVLCLRRRLAHTLHYH
jgi:hypothetical protein